ncbi:hypothetical protein M406DRAFT_72684 [Cryphonectria parasitica EP155]|uniref:Uncharacterized protein n=1 Tax=Cryphonectria parasitica (strain ATCC 38755 / EP155) TaxID=660469 RepID=A0A9P4XXF9_CRYP1|nr:uncharacterized protein M406DRAFT_72684 [Cryphonectria parasitica EP155]KAF3762704.1 hypothetical protein M406DRAFT_72684 [Cryphonectria parasitica EP155]
MSGLTRSGHAFRGASRSQTASNMTLDPKTTSRGHQLPDSLPNHKLNLQRAIDYYAHLKHSTQVQVQQDLSSNLFSALNPLVNHNSAKKTVLPDRSKPRINCKSMTPKIATNPAPTYIQDKREHEEVLEKGEDASVDQQAMTALNHPSPALIDRVLALSSSLDELNKHYYYESETHETLQKKRWLFVGCEPWSPEESPRLETPFSRTLISERFPSINIDLSLYTLSGEYDVSILSNLPEDSLFKSRKVRAPETWGTERSEKRVRLTIPEVVDD